MIRRAHVARAAADLAAVAMAWLLALLVENLVLGGVWGKLFSAAWEITQVRRVVVPLAFAGLAPASIVVVLWWRVAELASRRARLARAALAVLLGGGAAALAVGVTHGRHFGSWAVRAPFILVLVAVGAAVGAWLVPVVVGRLRTRPALLLAAGLAMGLAGWLGDAFILPRLYPAMHLALLLACLVGVGLVGLSLRGRPEVPERAWTSVVAVAALALIGAIAWSPAAARRLDRMSNLRVVVVEHAPILGRAVELVMSTRPQTPDTAPADAHVAPGEVARSLDWTGHDLVLVTIDALRADHVSAYGYGRPTTPNIDAIAARGARFDAAYCPTPHTSYSVTSMMTGKYLRPLLLMGQGEDSETWAQDLRLYGWRTAAFYPPAVFFIDEERFPRFEHESLGFEYAKVEFADPALRERQVTDYLASAPRDKPLFLWVHFFEPHEPYVTHPDHIFTGGSSPDVDAYDGEVATADDGVGRVVRAVAAARPGATVIVTADHGEEFGEHGGRYHGTTVYEEQVHVPLVIAGPGVPPGTHVASVVQTIDLLPTVLSALGVPRPARLRGRDLGPLLAGQAPADPGFAFAETDQSALVASGPDRLVCERRAAACALYRPASDPSEAHDVADADPSRAAAMHAELRAVERDHGRFEAAGGPAWPESLRRGMEGEIDAAADVASLLDDADVTIRRKAAEVCFLLHAPSNVPQLRRALAQDEDVQVRGWAALALVRDGDPPAPMVGKMLEGSSEPWRHRTALALGERGNPKACEVLTAWWNDVAPSDGQTAPDGEPPRLAIDLPAAQELLRATSAAHCRAAVPALVRALVDVRARPYVADALGALGDDRARAPLLAMLAVEPYVTSRPHEAAALVAIAVKAGATPPSGASVVARTRPPKPPARLVVWLSDPAAELDARVDGTAMAAAPVDGPVRTMPLRPASPGSTSIQINLRPSVGTVRAFWLVPVAALD